jgi:hypothetical protein
MAVNVEMWRKDIVEGLYASNRFLERAFNADEYVVGGRVVHIPQAGSPAPVQRNRTNLPAAHVLRGDTDIIYSLDEFTADPTLITDIDKKELSYDKRQSVISENTVNMKTLVGLWMIYNWTKNVPTGTTNRVVTSGAPGGGGFKILTEADVLAAQLQFNKMDIPSDGRVLLLDTDHEGQLRMDEKLKYAFQQVVNLPNGAIGRLHSFDIYTRSSVVKVSNVGAIKTPDAASAGTDRPCSMFYHESCVERALGEVNVFDNPNRAEFYGDLISFLVRMGGRNRRQDNKGVGLIVSEPAA